MKIVEIDIEPRNPQYRIFVAGLAEKPADVHFAEGIPCLGKPYEPDSPYIAVEKSVYEICKGWFSVAVRYEDPSTKSEWVRVT